MRIHNTSFGASCQVGCFGLFRLFRLFGLSGLFRLSSLFGLFRLFGLSVQPQHCRTAAHQRQLVDCSTVFDRNTATLVFQLQHLSFFSLTLSLQPLTSYIFSL